jgi:hypothetical protein
MYEKVRNCYPTPHPTTQTYFNEAVEREDDPEAKDKLSFQ